MEDNNSRGFGWIGLWRRREWGDERGWGSKKARRTGERGRRARLGRLAAVEPLLLLEVAVHPPERAGLGAAAGLVVGHGLGARGLGGEAHGGLGLDEGHLQLLGHRGVHKHGERVLGGEALDAVQLGELEEARLLGLVGTDLIVDVLEREAGRAHLGVLLGVVGHTTAGELSRVGDLAVLVEEVLEEGDLAVKVDVDLLAELLLAHDSGHHDGHGHAELGVVAPALAGGVVEHALAEVLVKVEADVEVELDALLVEVDERDALGVHVGVLHGLPRDGEDEVGLVADLVPVRVEEGHGLLREGLAGHVIEEGDGLGGEALLERLLALGHLAGAGGAEGQPLEHGRHLACLALPACAGPHFFLLNPDWSFFFDCRWELCCLAH
mmetsp:Transcript_25647/g.72615  ORF Transcript_25647/g.72615 Transcript_25647/m.72615 type:complete len:381 (+) Transcript_25647:14-1156(+)